MLGDELVGSQEAINTCITIPDRTERGVFPCSPSANILQGEGREKGSKERQTRPQSSMRVCVPSHGAVSYVGSAEHRASEVICVVCAESLECSYARISITSEK